MAWDAPDDFMEMPVEELAMLMLRAAADAEERKFYFEYFWIKNEGGHNGLGTGYGTETSIRKLGEAWDWLFVRGFTATSYAPRAHPSNRWERVPIGELREVTESGRQALGNPNALRDLSWASILSVPLHASIDAKVRAQFELGEYDLGVLVAYREVEIQVREAGGYSDEDYGQTLMRSAFNKDTGQT